MPWGGMGYCRGGTFERKRKMTWRGSRSALDIAEISLEASGALEVLSSEVRSEF